MKRLNSDGVDSTDVLAVLDARRAHMAAYNAGMTDREVGDAMIRVLNPPRNDVAAAGSGTPDDEDAEATAGRIWDGNADIRAEFLDNFGNYSAYCRAFSRGRVKILSSTRKSYENGVEK